MFTDAQVERLAQAIERHGALVAEALRPDQAEPAPAGCQHPPDSRDHSLATMGRARWTCTACGFAFDSAAAVEGTR